MRARPDLVRGFSCALLALVLASAASARPRDPEFVPPPSSACSDLWTCRLAEEVARTDRFLRERRYGLPFALDPRPLDYPLEVLRLNVMSQAMGYLNLYRVEHRADHRREAQVRLDYLLGLGDAALGNGARDGMIGYLFLDAYEVLGDARYREAGRRAAARCGQLPPEELVMNGGLMCAMNHAFLAKLDGNPASSAFVEAVVERTSAKQFEDGAFPHQPSRSMGRNTNYTAWMATELLLVRDLRPESELSEYLLLAARDFLEARVNPDGTIQWADSTTNYASDPDNGDSRGWTSELASIALDLSLAGRRSDAALVLERLFAMRLKGEALGGYPDKYAFIDTRNLWETGRPSITRTSLIFWYLTLLRRFDRQCSDATGDCVPMGSECPPLYQELGLCDGRESGRHECIAGRRTRCFDSARVRVHGGLFCEQALGGEVRSDRPREYPCGVVGSAICVGDACRDQCLDPERGECEATSRIAGAVATDTGSPDAGSAVRASVVSGGGGPFDIDIRASAVGARDNLSLQVLDFRRSETVATATVRLYQHGRTPVPDALVALADGRGRTLLEARAALPARDGVTRTYTFAATDTLVARLDSRMPGLEADTLDNVARVDLFERQALELGYGTSRPAAEQPGIRLVREGMRRFVVSLDRESAVELQVHDVAGRRLRVLWRGTLASGEHDFEWDGRDASGGALPRGVYFLRLASPLGSITTRTILLR